MREMLGLESAPSQSTLWRIVTGVDPQSLSVASDQLRKKLSDPRFQKAVSVDGKTLCSSRYSGTGTAQVVSACDHATGIVESSVACSIGEGELNAGRRLVKDLCDKRPDVSVITGDALYAEPVVAAEITKRGRHYVVKLKKINLTCSKTYNCASPAVNNT